MVALEEPTQTRTKPIQLPVTRLSILDPCLEIEPCLDCCLCSESLALYVNNRPIAVIAGTFFECISLNARLSQLRYRNPRR